MIEGLSLTDYILLALIAAAGGSFVPFLQWLRDRRKDETEEERQIREERRLLRQEKREAAADAIAGFSQLVTRQREEVDALSKAVERERRDCDDKLRRMREEAEARFRRMESSLLEKIVELEVKVEELGAA